ncbi:sodium/potassium/calcium exchanger 4a isoform X4 [Pangasianodon hypophthalmus]|uniref:sodium/potassium/calcium exchanger 4a isoform X4 n=1 Tax=Pangasianodon hypophthalmus TaxID=310915 RepID=UPI00230821FA|nr:sodium/potassium/calcium exchanger 4a isoform X4 [Pangasianodon hypophthalmus]
MSDPVSDLERSCSVSKKTMITEHFRVRKRREMLLAQVCVVCGVLLAAWCMSALLTKTGHGIVLQEHFAGPTAHLGRRLMATEEDNETAEKNCSEPAIHEFPGDMFTSQERTRGAVLLHIFAAVYMFLALAIVCDDYFVTSLEKICEKLHLSEDVAGATFMAAGSSAPELFASVIGVFITHGDVGVGTIVGSAVFNVLCIIGVCGIFAGQVVFLTKFAVFRDSLYYTLSVVALIVFIYDGQIMWWESLVLMVMYIGYIIIMKFNTSMQNYFSGKEDKSVSNGNAVISELEDGNACYEQFWDDPSWPLLSSVKPNKMYTRGSVVMVDEMMNSSPPNYRFPEAGLRVMITSHFGPKTRLRMASRLIINEQQRLVQASNGADSMLVADGKAETMENGNVPEDKLTEEEDNELSSPFTMPDGFCCDRQLIFDDLSDLTGKSLLIISLRERQKLHRVLIAHFSGNKLQNLKGCSFTRAISTLLYKHTYIHQLPTGKQTFKQCDYMDFLSKIWSPKVHGIISLKVFFRDFGSN